MTIVEITIHKHQCVICGDFFIRSSVSGEDGCRCGQSETYIEYCGPCEQQISDAGWIGNLVRRLIDRTIALNRRLEAIESKHEGKVP